jgi:hypothetical protein
MYKLLGGSSTSQRQTRNQEVVVEHNLMHMLIHMHPAGTSVAKNAGETAGSGRADANIKTYSRQGTA